MKMALGIAVGNQNKEEFTMEMTKWAAALTDEGWFVTTHSHKKGQKGAKSFTLGLVEDGSYDLVALFCHGYPRRIQLGHSADELRRAVGRSTLVLYCCSTGRMPKAKPRFDAVIETKGSFAHSVAFDPLFAEDTQVYAHTTAGHTTRNPYVLYYDGNNDPEWVIQPKSGKEWTAWRKFLNNKGRFLFPVWGPQKTRQYIARLSGITYHKED